MKKRDDIGGVERRKPKAGKKRYVRPELVRFGSLLKLTQSTGGTRPGDAGNMML